MFLKENLDMALDSIFANKMRSFLTMLGIIIGISSVISILAVGNGATRVITDTFSELGSTTIQLTANDPGSTNDVITDNDLSVLSESIDEIQYISPDGQLQGTLSTENHSRTAMVTYGTPDLQYINQTMDSNVEHGRYFNDIDYDEQRNVVVIDTDTAESLFNHTDVVGETIQLTISNTPISLQVVGVVEGMLGDMQGAFDEDEMPVFVSMPYTTLANYVPDQIDMDSVMIQIDDADNLEPISNQVVRLLELRHNVVDEGIYTAQNLLGSMEAIDTILNLFISFIAAVAGIALVVGGIGVMNIMLVSVTERTREIGTRKALGATTNTILVQFLMESIILSLIGGVIGLTLGILMSNAIAAVLDIVPEITVGSVTLVLVFSSAVGIFFGIYPAKKAAQLNPIEALRYE